MQIIGVDMTQEEIIEMAKEASGEFYVTSGNQTPTWYFSHNTIYDFAELVAAKEREACAKVCDELFKQSCNLNLWAEITAETCAKTIRARGEQV